jgi:hypothetical protein
MPFAPLRSYRPVDLIIAFRACARRWLAPLGQIAQRGLQKLLQSIPFLRQPIDYLDYLVFSYLAVILSTDTPQLLKKLADLLTLGRRIGYVVPRQFADAGGITPTE